MKKTNVNAIKKMAKQFLYLQPHPTDFEFIVQHPFTNSAIITIKKGEEFAIGNVNNEHDLKVWRKQIEKNIDISNLFELFTLMNKAYYLIFLKFISKYLSDYDLGTILNLFWCQIEQISLDTCMSEKQLINLFERSDKRSLMNEHDFKVYKELPNSVTIYRGVTSYNKSQKKALSWTLDKNTAIWFSNRFDTGTGEVWETTISKSKILCYFSMRKESEVIVDLIDNNTKFKVLKSSN